jgi:hypothetical protein
MTGRPSTGRFRRVDVFSASGGVGKTLLAIRLAQLQAQQRNAPVLLVDADISGPCLGDLLESWASPPWDSTDDLLHLICGRPEYLPDQLRPGKLPVYRMRDSCPPDRAPKRVTAPIQGEAVLFCPSHPLGINPRVEPEVLHALLGHESAGGWIGYVIHQVIRETAELMKGRLGGVIVDHGAALGALQIATLRECAEQADGGDDGGGERRALMVATQSASALTAARDLHGRITSELRRSGREAKGLLDRIVWIVNRIQPGAADWKESIKKRHPGTAGWLERALPVHADDALAESHAEADLPRDRSSSLDDDLKRVREAVFE